VALTILLLKEVGQCDDRQLNAHNCTLVTTAIIRYDVAHLFYLMSIRLCH
jgi:hypothetical protein